MPPEEQKPELVDPPATPAPETKREHKAKGGKWRILIIALGAVAILFFGLPRVFHSLRTVTTDDAYVNSYVTFVAPRVLGQVARVLVEDNNRVKKGDPLVELDPQPYRVQVAIKQAAVDSAEAEIVMAKATVRSEVGQLRSLRFKLQHA